MPIKNTEMRKEGTMKFNSLFPTLVTQFDHEFLFPDEMPNMINTIRQWSDEDNIIGTIAHKNHIDKHPHFRSLTKTIITVTSAICNRMGYESGDVIVKEMWASILKPDSHNTHAPHTHGNGVFSGVFYLKGGSDIILQDPRPQVAVLRPRVQVINEYNIPNHHIPSTPGTGIIFPGWLSHYVPRTDEERISVAFNIILKGNYGQEGSLAELKL